MYPTMDRGPLLCNLNLFWGTFLYYHAVASTSEYNNKTNIIYALDNIRHFSAHLQTFRRHKK